MVFNFFLLDMRLYLTLAFQQSPSHMSFFHMVISSSSKNYFQFMSIQWWFLEFNCDCPDLPIHCCQQFLVLCTNATLVRLVVWFSCMNSSIRKTFEISNFHVHGSNARLNCLSRSPSQIINSESNKKHVFVLTKKCVTCAMFRWMCCVNI